MSIDGKQYGVPTGAHRGNVLWFNSGALTKAGVSAPGAGYTFEQFFDDADAVGWRLDARFSTWEMHSPAHDDGFVVAVFTAVAPR